jgi:hypothetical protein
MKRASALVDEASEPKEYQIRLVALAMIARQYLRDLAPSPVPCAAPPADELQTLRDWKESALKQLAKSDVLHNALREHSEYLGWDVHEAAADLIRKLAVARELVKEASEIMQITYAGNFPAGIESFLVRADRVAAPVSPADKALDGAVAIKAERQRQIDREGWTAAHDDEHAEAEMVAAALCYASCAAQQARGQSVAMGNILAHWPWERSWWKPSDDPIRNLTKAGALIAAEIDRLQRVRATPPPTAGERDEETGNRTDRPVADEQANLGAATGVRPRHLRDAEEAPLADADVQGQSDRRTDDRSEADGLPEMLDVAPVAVARDPHQLPTWPAYFDLMHVLAQHFGKEAYHVTAEQLPAWLRARLRGEAAVRGEEPPR